MTTTLLGLMAGLLGFAPPAEAAPGPAPAPTEFRVLSKVHTDAVSTFLDDGDVFALGTKADTPDTTRYDPASLWFHVDDASRTTVPESGYGFIAPSGSEVWIAPESNPDGQQLWPGFSTEGVPNNAIAGNTTTLTLTGVRAPEGGAVEVFTGGGPGHPLARRWSSDEDHKTFTLGRTHMHANWAFTEPGIYELDVRAQVTLGGSPVSDTATYTFVVGDLPQQEHTTTTLTTSAESATQGSEVTLSAAVSATQVAGAVEFRRGSTVIGHDPVESGTAELTVSDLPVGTHEITARFVPETTNLATGSTSEAVTVTVTDEAGQPFAISGVEDSYEPGETMTALTVGAPALTADQEIRWRWRYQDTTQSIILPGRGATLTRVLSAVHDDVEMQAEVYDKVTKAITSSTPWAPVVVEHVGGEPVIEQVGSAPDPLYPGDSIDYRVTGRELGEGETLEWKFVDYGGYSPFLSASTWPTTYPVADKSQIHLTSRYNPAQTGPHPSPFVAYVVKGGVAISRSDLTFFATGRRELNVSGNRTLYREGGQVSVSATTYPARDDDDFTYTWTFTKRTGATETWGTAQQADPELTGPVLSKAAHNLGNLRLTLFNKGVQAQQSANIPIKVTDDLSTQILEFSALAGHYHQGDDVKLQLTVDPEPVAGDSVEWQWKWPGAEWGPMPGVVDNAWQAKAEQAMEGLEIRAVLTYADASRAPLVSAVRTVHVDDHGGAARQKPSVAGKTDYTEGEPLALSLELPANGPTILSDHRWERKASGSDEWTVIEGESGDDLSLPATPADDGASYRVSILKPTGGVAYGPSEPVTIAVTPETTERQFSLAPLADRYRQGDTIRMAAVGDPALTDEDWIYWEWSFPETDEWHYLPSGDGQSFEFLAEQGLDGAQVRATLYTSDWSMYVAEPVTIHLDDHGAPARQVPSIGGPTSFVEGEGLALRRELPEGVSTVLTDHRWERRAAGTDEWTVVAGQAGEELAVAATMADDGAAYRVSIAKPGGAVAYGPSEAVTVSITPETIIEFGLAGIAESYEVGDVLRSRVVGRALAEGQTWRYVIRPVGSSGDGAPFYGDGDYAATQQGRLRKSLDAGFDGYQIRARLREAGAYTGVDTAWETIEVATEEPVAFDFPEGPHWHGDEIAIPFDRTLAEDETVRLAYRQSGGAWDEASLVSVDPGVVRFMPQWAYGDTEFALQLVRDGAVVSVSAPVARNIQERETLVQGVQGVYRIGDTLSASATVFPKLEGMSFTWSLQDADGNSRVLKQGAGEDALSVEIPEMTSDLDQGYLILEGYVEHAEHGRMYPVYWYSELRVSDAAPDEQLLFFKSLSGHYHQGYTVNLDLVADPELADGDVVTWEWKWPGQDWSPFPGASGQSHELIAEQALNNVEVRATVDFADEGEDTMTTEPVTIHHDDHGGAARQRPTVAGDLAVVEGGTVTLTRELPANGATVLTEHRWEKKVGEGDWTVLAGETGAQLSFPASLDDDGAQYRVSILKPGGALAYGPSPAVTLEVDAAPAVENTALPIVTGDPVVGQTLSATAGEWSPDPDDVAYQWLADGEPINGATGSTLALTQAMVGQAIKVQVKAIKAGHADGVASSVATAPVTEPDQEPVATTVSAAGVRQRFGQSAQLTIAVSPQATGQVSVRVGSRTVTGQLAGGRATVTLPARALKPGKRVVQISYAGVPGQFQPSTGVGTVTVVKAKPTVKVKVLTRSVKRGKKATFKVVVSGAGVTPSGKIVIRVAGQRKVLTLNGRGIAVAKIAIPRSASPGVKTVVVAYRGDSHVEADRRTVARVRVTR